MDFFIILIQIMIRKVLLNKSLANFLLFKLTRPISLHYIKRASQKLQFNNSPIYGYKSFYLFSNEGNTGSQKSAIEEANSLYNTHGWSDEFIQQSMKNMAKYEQIQDWESLLTTIQFHLLKTKQNSGITNSQYVSRLSEGIYYAYVVGKKETAEQWTKILYEILSNNPQLGKDPFNNMHYQYEVAQVLGKVNNREQGHKWLELFKNKFKDFDKTDEITDNQRFFTYLQLTEYSGYANKVQQGVKYSKKTFDLIQQGKVENLQKQLQIAAIFNYGIAQYKFADKQTGIKAFNLIEQSFDENNASTLLLVLNICSSYSLVDGLIERGSALLQKYQKFYNEKKDIEEYRSIYDNSIFYRVRMYFMYQKYEKLYENLNIVFENYEKNMPNQTLFFYRLLLVLSQHKLGKKQEAHKSLEKTLQKLKENQLALPQKACNDLLNDVELVEKKMEADLSPGQKQILTQIKQLIKSR